MPELLGQHEDILTDMKLLNLYSRQEVTLSDDQKESLKHLPKEKREKREKELLEKQENEKKERLRIRTLELEDKVRKSDLPPDIIAEILEMTAYAKDRGMTYIYSVEKKIESLEERIKETEVQKAKEEEAQMKAIQNATMIGTAVVVGMALAPYVQVQFNKEEFEKRTEAVYESKILPALVMAAEKPIVRPEPLRTYPKKQGAMYSKTHYDLEKKHKDEWMALLVKEVQAEQKAKGQKVQTAEEIISNFEKLSEAKKRFTIKNLSKKYPKIAARQEAEKKAEAEATIKKGVERYRREVANRETKKSKTLGKPVQRSKRSLRPKKRPKYPKTHYELRKKHRSELMDALVRDIQASSKTKQTPEEIIAAFKKLPGVKKRKILHDIRLKYPELAARQDAEKKTTEEAAIQKSIERLRRKKAAKAERAARALAKKDRLAERSLNQDRIQRKGPRIDARESIEKPPEVKHVSPAANQAKMAPIAVKEEKEGISARLMKIEQINKAIDPEKMKGISAALTVAEQQKLQPIQDRIISESRGKFNLQLDENAPLTEKQKAGIAAVKRAVAKQGKFALQEEGKAPLNADQKKEMIEVSKIVAEKAKTAFQLRRRYR